MFRPLPQLTRTLPIIALIGFCALNSQTFAQKGRTETVSYSPPTLSVAASPRIITVQPNRNLGASQVELNANALSPDGNPIRYRWTASGGRITGTGPKVSWDLSGLEPGYYKASVQIDTGKDEETCYAFSSTTVLVKRAMPVCPNITISSPGVAAVDQPLRFVSSFANGSGGDSPTYNWTVSAGKIIAGQGTNSITVDTKGLAGQTITASLNLGGYNLYCAASSGISIPVPLICRKFDEFPKLARNDEKARLDNFAIELQNDPTLMAHVVVHPGRDNRAADVANHKARVIDYLVNSRRIDQRRIVTVVGPQEAELMVELWACPPGSKPKSSQ